MKTKHNINIILIVSIIIASFCIIPETKIKANTNTTNYSIGTYECSYTTMNLRSGAGLGYDIIGVLKKGEVLEITEIICDSDGKVWGKAQYSGNIVFARMDGGYLLLLQSANVGLENNSTNSTNYDVGIYECSYASMNLRSGAGLNYNIIGVLKKGEVLEITEIICDSDGKVWGKAQYSGNIVFARIDGGYLSFIRTSNNQSDEKRELYRANYASMNLRSGPGLNFDKIGTLYQGQTIEIVEIIKNGKMWGRGYVNGNEVYARIDSGYLTKVSDSTNTIPEQLSSRISNFVNCALGEVGYKAPAKNKSKYGTWYGSNGPWCVYFVEYCSEKAGYTVGSDIKRTGSSTALRDWFSKNGNLYSTPNVGDIIFFNLSGSDKTVEHTGIVVCVNRNTITTVEGNSQNKVRKLTHKINSSKIAGYGRLN